jgi:predicted phage-related endonuclease
MSLTAQQLLDRRGFVGGSEIGAILGLNPFMGPIDVYLAKVEGYQRPATPDMERGIYLEDGVAKWFSARMGVECREVGTLRDSVNKHVGCTPDRLYNDANGQSRLLSIKVPGNYLSEEWGEPHAWRVPTGYYLQLQYELGVCGAMGLCQLDCAKLAAPLGGDLQILDVPFDAEVARRLFEEAEVWWATHITPRNCGACQACCRWALGPEGQVVLLEPNGSLNTHPPPLDGSEGARQWLRRRFPRSEHPVRAASFAEDVLALELQTAEHALTAAEKAYEKARQPVEEAIGDAEGIEGAFGRVTFKANKKGVRSLRTTWTSTQHLEEQS